MTESVTVPIAEKVSNVVNYLRVFTESKEFNIFIFIVIIVAGVSVGIQTSPGLSNSPGAFAMQGVA